jgi:hypothetical protein
MVGESTKDHIGTDLQAITSSSGLYIMPKTSINTSAVRQRSLRAVALRRGRQKPAGRRNTAFGKLLWNRVFFEIRHREFSD